MQFVWEPNKERTDGRDHGRDFESAVQAFAEIPELTDKFWQNAKQGQFYRPLKQQLTPRPDADVVSWFKAHMPEGDGYQTHIDRALRQYAMTARLGPGCHAKINREIHISAPALTFS